MNIQKQIEYWKESSDEDFAAAQSLLEKGHFRHSLFFAHLALEKMLKAHVTKRIKDIPPRIHNLVRLVDAAEISIDTKMSSFLRSFDMYQLEGRYPDRAKAVLNLKVAREKLSMAGDILKWLKAKL
jgi:HEPN domain-containing protein